MFAGKPGVGHHPIGPGIGADPNRGEAADVEGRTRLRRAANNTRFEIARPALQSVALPKNRRVRKFGRARLRRADFICAKE
jgi:hypothetical protein